MIKALQFKIPDIVLVPPPRYLDSLTSVVNWFKSSVTFVIILALVPNLTAENTDPGSKPSATPFVKLVSST